MLGALRTSAARAARTAARNVRNISNAGFEAEVAEAQKEANKWKMISFAAIPVCIGLAAVTLSNAHTHHRKELGYPYLGYKVRDFPWGPDSLFGTK